MSWQANEAVRKYSKSKGGARLLMIMLSNYANPDGSNCHPGLALLASDTKLTVRQIQNSLRLLEADGELVIEYRKGPKLTNVYWLNLPEGGFLPPERLRGGAGGEVIAPPAGTEVVKSPPESGEVNPPQVVKPTSPNPSVLDPSVLDPSGVSPHARAHAREIRPVPKPGQRAAAARAAALASALAEAEDRTADRLALLARLETTSADQVWWGEEARRPPRLRDAFRAAIFVPPRQDRRVAALVFGNREALTDARGSPRDLALAQRRIESRYFGLMGDLVLIDLAELDRPALAGR